MTDVSPSSEYLEPNDVLRLDALVEGAFAARDDTQRATLDQRGRKVLELLELLDTPASPPQTGGSELSTQDRRSLLIDVTMARVLRQRRADQEAADTAAVIWPATEDQTLAPADAEAMNALVTDGWDSSRADGSERVSSLLSLLDAGVGRASDSLVDRTLSRIQGEIDSRERRLRLTPEAQAATQPSRGFRLADLVAVAAMLLIGTAILWPVLVSSRANVFLNACQSNMHQAGVGFSLYANDHDGRLPRSEEFSGDEWWHVGDPAHSHSANLYRLIREGYSPIDALACPGNPFAPTAVHDPRAKDWSSHEQVSYSFQLFFSSDPRFQASPGAVLLTDRSPLVSRAIHDGALNPDSRSRNHAGRGQHVLFGDMRVTFLHRPYVASGDNLWLPRDVEQGLRGHLTGSDRPSSPDDAFVGP